MILDKQEIELEYNQYKNFRTAFYNKLDIRLNEMAKSIGKIIYPEKDNNLFRAGRLDCYNFDEYQRRGKPPYDVIKYSNEFLKFYIIYDDKIIDLSNELPYEWLFCNYEELVEEGYEKFQKVKEQTINLINNNKFLLELHKII